MFKNFRIGDLFDIRPTKAYEMKNAELYQTQGNVPVLSNSSVNNGIGGYAGLPPTEKGGIITFSDTTSGGDTMFYQVDDFIGYPHIQGMYPLTNKWDKESCLYAIAAIRRAAGSGWSYAVKFNRALVKELEIELPVISNADPDHNYTVKDIDWQYMHDYIVKIKSDDMSRVDAYVQAEGLKDCELTEEEKEILTCKNVKIGEFELGQLFDIYSPIKRFNANAVKFGGNYPYIARGSTNNGIKGYITEDIQYLSPAKTLSFGQDTSTVFYQPEAYFTGDKIKVMALRDRELTPELAQYLIPVISRAFTAFAWGQNSFKEEILKQIKIVVPIKNGQPDFNYMEKYIRAIEKQVISKFVKPGA